MSISNITNRVDQICNLLEELDGVVHGRKKLQKIVFIASELGLLPHQYHDFDWNYYGVYSYELASDIDIANRLQFVKEEEEYDGLNTSYKYELGEKGNEVKTEFKLNGDQKFILEKDARFLEVLSSIFYFARKYNDDDKIRDILSKFKGHLSSYFDEAFETYHNFVD